MTIRIALNDTQIEALNKPLNGTGGFQSLINKLRRKAGNSGIVELNDAEVGRINRYAFRYDNGGWQRRLEAIFGEHLWTRIHAAAS